MLETSMSCEIAFAKRGDRDQTVHIGKSGVTIMTPSDASAYSGIPMMVMIDPEWIDPLIHALTEARVLGRHMFGGARDGR